MPWLFFKISDGKLEIIRESEAANELAKNENFV